MNATSSRPRTVFVRPLCILVFLIGTVQAQSPLMTTLAGGSVTIGSMFDLKSVTGVIIDDFDVKFGLISVGLPTVVEVWAKTTPGTYVGSQFSNANWTLLASVPVTGLITQPYPLGLSLGHSIPVGQTQAFYVTVTSNSGLRMEDTIGTAIGSLYASDANLEFYEGQSGTYFNINSGATVWNGNIYYSQLATVADDVAITELISPVNDAINCSLKTAAETVEVRILNSGLNSIPAGTLLNVSYSVNGGPAVVEVATVPMAMATGDTLQHTFATPADLSVPGSYSITASVLYGLDLDPTNDMITETIGSGGQLRVTNYPFLEDFDLGGNAAATTTPPLGFINETTDSTGANSDWIFRDDATPTVGTGPNADNSTGVSGMGGYAYIEDDGNLSPINLRSPCFDLSSLVNPSMRFFLHSENTLNPSSNPLSVDVITYPGGAITTDVFGPQNQTGPNWNRWTVSLAPYVGQLIQLVFRGTSNQSGGNINDVAIDDVSVADLVPTPGQAPQPGLAVLDMNGCLNANGDPLAFGLGGPYFTSVSAGGTLVFDMAGTPMQPILLFTGSLNPANASFPGVGTIDLGGPVDPMTGIPMGLVVLADGAAFGGFNPFFVTSANGTTEVGFSVPSLPIGVLGSFQCAFLTTAGPGVALSNAVQLSVQ